MFSTAEHNVVHIVSVISHGDPIAFGLFHIQYPNRQTTIAALENNGQYPAKGELSLVKISYPSRKIEVIFNPTEQQLREIKK